MYLSLLVKSTAIVSASIWYLVRCSSDTRISSIVDIFQTNPDANSLFPFTRKCCWQGNPCREQETLCSLFYSENVVGKIVLFVLANFAKLLRVQ